MGGGGGVALGGGGGGGAANAAPSSSAGVHSAPLTIFTSTDARENPDARRSPLASLVHTIDTFTLGGEAFFQFLRTSFCGGTGETGCVRIRGAQKTSLN